MLVPLPVLQDNYVWMWVHAGRCLLVDPGVAEPVLAQLAREALTVEAILITHHHADHIGGVEILKRATGAAVFGPRDPRIPGIDQAVADGDRLSFASLAIELDVLSTPGHTNTHVSYFGGGILFCGDTLFSLGCGRVFEGSPKALYASLARLAALPSETLVCPAHEYTVPNAAFALTVEPHNPTLRAHAAEAEDRRAAGLPTLPSTIARERASNPFLRCHLPAVQQAVGLPNSDPAEVFAALRAAKDRFPGAIRLRTRMP